MQAMCFAIAIYYYSIVSLVSSQITYDNFVKNLFKNYLDIDKRNLRIGRQNWPLKFHTKNC